jgi:predicted GNAT family N-acyltransferase
MILQSNYDTQTIRSLIQLKCDYCGKEFQRIKKSRERHNKIINKDSCGEKACRAAKQKEICIIKHGVPTIFDTETFKQKQQKTNLEKYGTKEYFESDDFKEKRKQSLLDKYGVESPLQSEDIRNKQQETNLKKYGHKNYANTEGFAEKRSATNLEKYGAEHVMQNPECLKKRNKTCKEKFGEESYVQTEAYWKQRKQTCLKRYGVEHPSQLEENRNKAKKTNLERYGVQNYSQTKEYRERFIKTCMYKFGVPNPLCLQGNQIYGKTQKDIQTWLNSMGFSFEKDYSLLGTQEIDLYDKNTNIGIEYCGLFWHNELSPSPRLKFYHYDKYISCLKQGVQLITIFEDEWKTKQEQCKGILCSILGKQKNKVYARKCKINECDRHKFNQFCNKHHLQASNNLGLVFYVLEHDNEIVAAMSLGRHHRNSEKLTLDRLCFRSDVQVIGGASKLFKKCKEWAIQNKYKEIITWSDNRWSQGNVYKQLGFVLGEELSPDYSYVNAKRPYERLSKQSQKKSLTGCPKDITEAKWSHERGLARIWDCGKKRWLFSLNTLCNSSSG